MSILIRGMEMPKTAFNCSVKVNPDERQCIFTGKTFEETFGLLMEHRCPGCPLVEIPTPHGRLIDADALYKRLLKQQDGHEEELAIGDYVFRSIIAAAPTVIESEE